jgi:rare lipoprotein A
MKRITLCSGAAFALVVVLAACSSAPRKAAPRAAGHGRNAQGPASGPAAARHDSPYAAAQEDLRKRGDYVAGGLYAPGVRDSAPDGLEDIALIPEPEVKDEPRSRYGNRSPYKVLGKTYEVLDSADGYVEEGSASFYGNKFHRRRTSSLEVYDMYAFSAAHRSLPLPSYARVTNLDNGRSVVVRVNDRGPFHAGRIIDLSYAAAVKLGIDRKGTGHVRVEGLSAQRLEAGPRGAGASAAPAAASSVPAQGTAIDRLVASLPIGSAVAAERTPAVSAAPTPLTDYRFDMRQDGKPMTVKEFDAWMKARRVSVATGKPGRLARIDAKVKPLAPPPVAPGAGVAGKVATPAPSSAGWPAEVTLQVASFASEQNASRALTMLRGAGIGDARLQDAQVDGQKLWRLRVGPVRGGVATELAGRIAGLGFGQPRVVKD